MNAMNLSAPPLVGSWNVVPSNVVETTLVGVRSRVLSVLAIPTMITCGISPCRARKSTVPRVCVRWASPSVR